MPNSSQTQVNEDRPSQTKSLTTPTAESSLYEWLGYLGALHVSAIDMGLERVLPVAEHLGLLTVNHAPKPKIFTVAGTNGKGSVTKTISTLCGAAGFKTALYQSPHVFEFNERVSIDGKTVTDQQLVTAFAEVEVARQACGLSLSFFEATTLAAFLIFLQENCDVWVLEVGLGGRLDVVNIIDPDVAVITNIGIDHTDWLGSDIQKIGLEKAGILRPNIPCVLGSPSGTHMPKSVCDKASALDCTVFEAGVDFFWQLDDANNKPNTEPNRTHGTPIWLYSSQASTLRLPLPKLALNNVATGITAALAGGVLLTPKALSKTMPSLSLLGRFHTTTWQNSAAQPVSVVCDAAHNPAGAAFFIQQLLVHFPKLLQPEAGVHVVFSMLGDKDIAAVVAVFATHFEKADSRKLVWHIAPLTSRAAIKRAASVERIHSAITEAYTTAQLSTPSVYRYKSVAEAFDHAASHCTPKGAILVCGSFHTLDELADKHQSLLR